MKPELAAEFSLAVDKLELSFIAKHGGGYPDCLKNMTPNERLRYLSKVGYRVKKDRVVIEDNTWADISNSITVCLTDGFVCKIAVYE